MKKKKKIGILTGGGDCPGLNPVIAGVVRKAMREHMAAEMEARRAAGAAHGGAGAGTRGLIIEGEIMTFCGSYCDDFKNGTAMFDGTYGCPPAG